MPTIEFEAHAGRRKKTVEAPEGGDLLAVCDEVMAPIPFSCRSATCGTCHINVVEGAELLEPPDEEERELLELLKGPATSRLACKAQLKPLAGTVRILPLV